jgi:signal transduction histidine kinase
MIVVQATQGETHWAIEIEDQGPGIEPESLEVIFEPFFTTRSKGTGLGLAFASQVVFAHGGQIKGENRPNNRGARFTMELPLNRGVETG